MIDKKNEKELNKIKIIIKNKISFFLSINSDDEHLINEFVAIEDPDQLSSSYDSLQFIIETNDLLKACVNFAKKTKKTERWMNQMHGLTVLSDDTL